MHGDEEDSKSDEENNALDGDEEDSKSSGKGPDKDYFSGASKDSDYDAAKDKDDPFADTTINVVGPEELYHYNLEDDGYAVVNTSNFTKYAFAWELIQYYLKQEENTGSIDQSRSMWKVCFNDKKLTKKDEKTELLPIVGFLAIQGRIIFLQKGY